MDASKFKAATSGKSWNHVQAVGAAEWTCGYCGKLVASDRGWSLAPSSGGYLYIRICSYCAGPTFFLDGGEYSPSPTPGRAVDHVPADLAALYGEARATAGAGAPTAAVMACRTILMHIAVQEGAQPGQSFVSYVDYLVQNHFAPPKSKAWIDYIRQRILRLLASGGTRLVHSREMKVIERYSVLGAEGKNLAMLLLRLGRGRLGH